MFLIRRNVLEIYPPPPDQNSCLFPTPELKVRREGVGIGHAAQVTTVLESMHKMREVVEMDEMDEMPTSANLITSQS